MIGIRPQAVSARQGWVSWSVVASAALVSALLTPGPALAQSGSAAKAAEHWVGTWTTAVVPRPGDAAAPAAPFQAAPPPPPVAPGAPARPPDRILHFNNQTIRQIVRTSIGGGRLRVELSNRFGTAPIVIGAASVALRDKDSAIVSGSSRALGFSGRPSITIPAGALVVSDPVALTVPAQGDLAIDFYLPGDTSSMRSPLTMHRVAVQTNYLSQGGNHAGAASLPIASTFESWFLLSRVEVVAPESVRAIVTFGDSITDGTRSTADTNNRWPNHLAERLKDKSGRPRFAVLNAAISGNRVLSEAAPLLGVNALARFDADALLQPGVKYIVVLEGINDIGMARQSPLPSAADIIAAHRQFIERAHARGLKIFGGTLLPFEGAAYWSPEGEAKRQAVNEWLRTARAYDGLIDFDAAMRDPGAPTKILPKYNSGDNLHPNDVGYQAMANAVDLSLFTK